MSDSEALDLSGEGKASDEEIKQAAARILQLLKFFDSPKDAAAVFVEAHYKMITAAFPPRFAVQAVAAVELHMKLVVNLLSEGWQ
jgi:hypothetical protein